MKARAVLALSVLLSLACNYVSSLSLPQQVKPINLQAELVADGITEVEFGS